MSLPFPLVFILSRAPSHSLLLRNSYERDIAVSRSFSLLLAPTLSSSFYTPFSSVFLSPFLLTLSFILLFSDTAI